MLLRQGIRRSRASAAERGRGGARARTLTGSGPAVVAGRRPPSRSATLAAGVAVAVGLAATAACTPPAVGLTVTTVVTGLQRPWDVAFTPDGSMLVTERTGRISVVDQGQGTTRLIAAPADVVVAGEGGMLGIAVDPGFAANRRVYTCQTSNLSGAIDVRVVRWRLDDVGNALTQRTDIVTGLAVGPGGEHPGCRLRFGPDGFLWVATGDAKSPTVPQSPTALGGKVLRVTTDGAGAPGNPGGALDPRIYTYGHRNVQGLTFSPGGRPYAIEHGTDRDDEVNLLVAGANYGWNPVDPAGSGLYDDRRPMTDLTLFPDARLPVWTSGHPTIAPSGGTFLPRSGWGEWNGALVLAVLKGHQLRLVRLDGTGTRTAAEGMAVTDRGRLRSAVVGPDGALYVTTDETPGDVLRVAPPDS